MEEGYVKKKGHKVLLTFLIIFLVIGAFVGGFFISKLFVDKEPKKEENKKEEKNFVEVAVESEKVKLAFESLKKLSLSDKTLYGDERYNIDSITDKELLATALKQMPDELVGYCGDFLYKGPVSVETINKYLKPVIENKPITFDLIKKLATYYDEPNKVYETRVDDIVYLGLKGNDIYIGNNMCEGDLPSEIIYKKVIKAEELDNTLYIYEKRAFYVGSFEENNVKYYKDPEHKNYIETKKATIVESFMSSSMNQLEDLNWDLYNTYKYTFKLHNGYYYFQSVKNMDR